MPSPLGRSKARPRQDDILRSLVDDRPGTEGSCPAPGRAGVVLPPSNRSGTKCRCSDSSLVGPAPSITLAVAGTHDAVTVLNTLDFCISLSAVATCARDDQQATLSVTATVRQTADASLFRHADSDMQHDTKDDPAAEPSCLTHAVSRGGAGGRPVRATPYQLRLALQGAHAIGQRRPPSLLGRIARTSAGRGQTDDNRGVADLASDVLS